MKKVTIAVAVVLTALALFLLLAPRVTHSDEEVQATSTPQLTERQEIWLSALAWCESRGVDTAVNPEDRDGTPSYGRYQFKPSTYAHFADLYGFASTTDYMNAEAQKAIVSRMILDPDTAWEQQFPDCVKRIIGRPPKA